MVLDLTEVISPKDNQTFSFLITDESYVGAARRKAIMMAQKLQFLDSESDKIAIIVNELGSNLIKHATKTKSRQLLFQFAEVAGQKVFEIMSLDKGPGITNISQSQQDGYSTTGTAGTGLGAISRLADYYEIYSLPLHGTSILARIHSKNIVSASLPGKFEINGICLPKTGEEVSGDSWAGYQTPTRSLIMVADGLGHGPYAAEASQLACKVFHKNIHQSPAQILTEVTLALRKTRGAAVAITEIDNNLRRAKFTGLGNIAASIIINNKVHHLIGHDGTAGMDYNHARIQEYTYPWDNTALLLMHSDGLTSRWSFDPYPGLRSRDNTMIAGSLCRDFVRGNDDMTLVVVKDKLSMTVDLQ